MTVLTQVQHFIWNQRIRPLKNCSREGIHDKFVFAGMEIETSKNEFLMKQSARTKDLEHLQL